MKINWREIFKINWQLVPLKFVMFTFGFATLMVLPYMTLQMVSIGLNLNDIALITALVQVVSFLATPLASFLGDLVGPKMVLFFDIILIGVSGTCIDLTPRFREYVRNPSLNFVQTHDSTYQIDSIIWPPKDCPTNNFSLSLCEENGFTDGQSDFWQNITQYLECPENYPLNISFFSNSLSIENLKGNGSFCAAKNENGIHRNESSLEMVCLIKSHPQFDYCLDADGSSSTTFWIYLSIRSVFQTAINSGYALIDGTSLNYIQQYNCDYSMLLLWNTISSAISPYVASLLIEEPEDPLTSETNYNIAFYFMDGILAISFIGVLFIKVVVEKSSANVKGSALATLFLNPAIINFMMLNLFLGTGWGVADAYLAVYLRESLGASFQLIGIGSSISIGSCIPFTPISTWAVQKIGAFNTLTMAGVLGGLRLIAYGFIIWSPPYHFLILSTLDFFCFTWQWVACMYYIEKIVPNSVGGTLIGIVGATQNVLGRAVGSFLAGQLVGGSLMISIPEAFQVLGASTAVGAFGCLIIYRLACIKYEKKLLKNKIGDEGKEEFPMKFLMTNVAGISRL